VATASPRFLVGAWLCGCLNLLLPLGAGTALQAAAAGPAPPPELGVELRSLLADLPSGTQAGVAVAEADSGVVWFGYQPDVPLRPASCLKLLVAAAALERFGPGFEYQTRVLVYGDELWVVGAGDPGLGDERIAGRRGQDVNQLFDDWAALLRQAGRLRLGKIVLDDSIFDDQARHPDWPDSQADRWYQAPVGGLNINDNCLDVSILVRGKAIELRLRPDLPPGTVRNLLSRGRRPGVSIRRLPGEVFEVSGAVAGARELDPVPAGRPTVFFAQALKQGLERGGIQVLGDVVRRRLDEAELAAASPLACHTTGLTEVLWRCNTFSQNLFAECLLKSLAAYEPDGRRSGQPGSWEAGVAVLRSTLGRLGIELDGAVIRDGSGLSDANRLSADQLVRLLVRMRQHRYGEVFRASLAEPGQPGSMQKRYDEPALRGRLRAKTGTLAHVRSLAGYLDRPDGTVLAFALIINGPCDPAVPVRVCKLLLAAGGE